MQLAFCSEAAAHLQELKDRLIAVSNELLDNAADLSPQHSENLRQERFVLKANICSAFRCFCFMQQGS